MEFILLWEQELQELGHKAGQSRSLTEHIIEDHAEFWCLCLAIPQVYISDSVDEWYDEDTHDLSIPPFSSYNFFTKPNPNLAKA